MAPGKDRIKNTYSFKYHNENPKGYVNEGDCVTRAFACAFNTPWEVIMTEQWAFGILNGRALSCENVINMVAERHDYIRMKQPKQRDGTKYDPAEFCQICGRAGCKDPIVLHLSHHLVTIKRCNEGHYKVFDTWDSSHYSRVGYYFVTAHDEKKLRKFFSLSVNSDYLF